jgi:hypothetical protein
MQLELKVQISTALIYKIKRCLCRKKAIIWEKLHRMIERAILWGISRLQNNKRKLSNQIRHDDTEIA